MLHLHKKKLDPKVMSEDDNVSDLFNQMKYRNPGDPGTHKFSLMPILVAEASPAEIPPYHRTL